MLAKAGTARLVSGAWRDGRVTRWTFGRAVPANTALHANVKVLPDGRNAHLIQQPPRWWLPRIMDRFELVTFNRGKMGFFVTVEPKRR